MLNNNKKGIAIYIHIPFCIKKCSYCDFFSFDCYDYLKDDYKEALLCEMSTYKNKLLGYKVTSVFIGGGTPTVYNGKELSDIINRCRNLFNIDNSAEITVEANPGTVSREKLEYLYQAGVNRISMGQQAWQLSHLKLLGRIHGNTELINNINAARKVGFQNINIDIMFGLPYQTMDDWKETVSRVCELDIDHISMYSLKVEQGTQMYKLYKEKPTIFADDELDREMYHWASNFIEVNGLNKYEISNFAKDGKECLHNLTYWHNNEYIGLGPSAHSLFGGLRFSNITDIKHYIDLLNKGDNIIEKNEVIDLKTEIFETIMLGLRLKKGLDREAFFNRFGKDITSYYSDVIEKLNSMELLKINDNSLYLTDRGMDIQNSVLVEFLKKY